MKLLLVSGRDPAPGPRWERDAAFAAALAASGCEVTWVVPRPGGADGPQVPAAAGVRVDRVESDVPGFAAVQDRLLDPATEVRMTELVRSAVPDLVHVLDYGGATSVNATWAVNRLGARCVVTVDVDATLCHRGDLRFAGREPCSDWLDPKRCARCCVVAAPDGLGPTQSLLGRLLTAVRLPINPYPTEMDFLNRTDLLIGGLQFVEAIFVPTEEDGARLGSLGVREDAVVTLPPWSEAAADPEPYLTQYRRLVRATSGDESQLA